MRVYDSYSATLVDDIMKRASKEYEDFLSAIRKQPVDNIIDSAFKIDTMRNVMIFLEDSSLAFSNEELRFLAALPSITGYLYEAWRDYDDNEFGTYLEETIHYDSNFEQ